MIYRCCEGRCYPQGPQLSPKRLLDDCPRAELALSRQQLLWSMYIISFAVCRSWICLAYRSLYIKHLTLNYRISTLELEAVWSWLTAAITPRESTSKTKQQHALITRYYNSNSQAVIVSYPRCLHINYLLKIRTSQAAKRYPAMMEIMIPTSRPICPVEYPY